MNKTFALGVVLSALLATTAAATTCATGVPVQLSSGNWYQLVSGGGSNVTYAQAKAAAAALSHLGNPGYLATITSAAENNHIANSIGSYSSAWIAGTDSAAEGMFRWDAGPENGNLFWNGAPVVYANFAAGEPNNTNNDDFVEIAWWSATWNDATGNFGNCYVVEYAPIPEPAAGILGLAGMVLTGLMGRRRIG
ncbi:MAG: lectin-like protein [Planctomycetota bacterium]|nr:lectin-like protein [Planctomycetota bacterium]